MHGKVISWQKILAPAKPRQVNPAPVHVNKLAPATSNKNIKKRARSKFLSNQLATALFELNTPMRSKYARVFKCGTEIVHKGDKLTSTYCGCRWCFVCNRIRTGKLINSYLELSEALTDAHFVTLTVRNLKATNLQDETERTATAKDVRWVQRKMYSHLRKVQDLLRKHDITIKGIKSYECIPSKDFKGIRPHIHWKIDGTCNVDTIVKIWLHNKLDTGRLTEALKFIEEKKQSPGYLKGALIIELWLKTFKGAADRKGQQVKRCTPGSEKELFKYETKVVISNKDKQQKETRVPLRVLDVIYQSMQNVRAVNVTGFITRKPTQPKPPKPPKVYTESELQRFEAEQLQHEKDLNRWREKIKEYELYRKLTKKLTEDINENLEAETIEDLAPIKTIYTWNGAGWHCIATGQPLVQFEVTKRMARFIEYFDTT